MGNQLLKKAFLCIGIGTALMAGSINTSKVDELVRKIKEPRKGLSAVTIAKAYDPFIYEKKKVIKKIPSQKKIIHLRLTAIINDKAKINNRWLSVGNYVKGYKVVKVYPDKVVLKSKKGLKILSMKHKKSHKIKLLQVKE